jgi:hypothetical protein
MICAVAMKRFVLLLPGLAVAGLAQPPSIRPAARLHADPNQIVCETIRETGSRLNVNRICMTNAQWRDLRRQIRQDVDRAQAVRVRQGM